jgi:hypothetical protein
MVMVAPDDPAQISTVSLVGTTSVLNFDGV